MRSVLTLCFAAAFVTELCASTGDSVASLPKSRLFAEIVSDADYATIAVSSFKGKAPITVRDHSWISQFAATLNSADYLPQSPILAIATPISFYGKKGVMLLDIEVFRGIIRVDSRECYDVGIGTCEGIRHLVKLKTANQLPDTTSSSATPPADVGVAASVAADH
jgi:hypothetical protein